jgi:3-dehydroquinate synthase
VADYSRVFLTGFSGTGKSSVASLVAMELGWHPVDTDKLVEKAAGKPIHEIFDTDGEQHFRILEREAVGRTSREKKVVVATGGGAILDLENRRAMGTGLVVCLDATPESIVNLLSKYGGPKRPLLRSEDPLTRVKHLKAERERFYALSDLTISTSGRRPTEFAKDVVQAIRQADDWYGRHPERLLLPEERSERPVLEPIVVNTPSRQYEVRVGWGLLDHLGELLRATGITDAAWIVSDSTVLPCHGDRALRAIRAAGLRSDAFAIPAGEGSKRLDVAATVYDWLVTQRVERSHAIIALGGGVVGDLAGFVSATYLRGLPLIMVPTSVLSMVDASIGGKVAVDHVEGKNLIGAFHQPSLVVDDVSVLKSLPRPMLVEGYAEAIKHALVRSPELLSTLEEHADDLLHVEPARTVDVVRQNVTIKASVVAQDEQDTGIRAILNYGHTIGHAIEAVGGYMKVLHGAADAIGMTAAARIGERIGVTPTAVVARQQRILERFGLPTRAPTGIAPDRVLDAMMLDKKVEGGRLRWVLLEDIGRPVVRDDVPMDVVREVALEVLS